MDGTIVLWDSTRQSIVRRFEGHTNGIASVVAVHEHGLLVSAGVDREVSKSDQNNINLIGSLKVLLNGKYYPSQTLWNFTIDSSIDIYLLQ